MSTTNYWPFFLTALFPCIVILIGILVNKHDFTLLRQDFRDLSAKVDRHYESFNNQITTLLTTIHNVDTRVVKLEERPK
jgi:hypothetical protein